MAKDKRIIVGIDVGTSKIVTLIASYQEMVSPPVNVLGVSQAKALGVKTSQIVDIEECMQAVNASLEGAERMAGYSVSHTVLSMSGKHIESQNSRGVVAVSDPDGEISESDRERVIEAAKAISLPSSREILHVLPRGYIVDGQEGIKDPIGMTGIRLEVETHIITASSTALGNLVKVIEEVGVDVDDVVFSGLASALSVLSETEKDLGVMLVDVGAGTTDVALYLEGALAYSSVVGIGARHITNDLAIGLRISLESAEKMKLFLSEKRSRAEGGEETSDEVDLKPLNLPEDIKKVSRKTLIEGIVKPRLNEIFTLVGMEIKKSGFGGQIPSGIVITGGGAQTVSVAEAAKRMLSMPVRIGFPREMTGLMDEIQTPSFATVVGLITYAGRGGEPPSLPFGLTLPKLPFTIPMKQIFKKGADIVKSFLP